MKKFQIAFSLLTIIGVSCTDLHEEDVPVSFEVNESKLDISSAPATLSIKVSSGEKWDVPSMPEWVNLQVINRSESSYYEWNAVFSVSGNDEYNRDGIILFKAGTNEKQVIVAQDGKKGKYIAVESVSLSPKKLTLSEGELASLSFDISPSNASIKDVIWKS